MKSRSRARQALAALAAGALLLSAVLVAQPQPTTAAFTDNEYARGAATAGTLVTPTITSCTVQRAVLTLIFESVTITWTSPYPKEQVRLSATRSGTTHAIPSAQISVSGPVNGLYTYSATLSNGLLAELLGNLFGSTTTLTVWNVYPGHWVSPTRTRQLDIALLGLNPRCH